MPGPKAWATHTPTHGHGQTHKETPCSPQRAGFSHLVSPAADPGLPMADLRSPPVAGLDLLAPPVANSQSPGPSSITDTPVFDSLAAYPTFWLMEFDVCWWLRALTFTPTHTVHLIQCLQALAAEMPQPPRPLIRSGCCTHRCTQNREPLTQENS